MWKFMVGNMFILSFFVFFNHIFSIIYLFLVIFLSFLLIIVIYSSIFLLCFFFFFYVVLNTRVCEMVYTPK